MNPCPFLSFPMRSVYVSTILMFGLWLALSGHYTALLLVLGVLSALGVSLLGKRMGVLDEEGLPMGILIRLPRVTLWIIWEILKSNLGAIRVIIWPSTASAQLVTVSASQRTAAGLVTHANFITLTPGTVSVQVDEERNEIIVHGLTQEFCDAAKDGSMDAKVSLLEKRTEPEV